MPTVDMDQQVAVPTLSTPDQFSSIGALLTIGQVDRLISELQLTPLEAWQHLRRLVENVNALTAMLVAAEDMAGDRYVQAAVAQCTV